MRHVRTEREHPFVTGGTEKLRRCGRCKEQKPVEEFAWRRKAMGQRHNMCRPRHSAYHRNHYLQNKQRYIDQARTRKQKLARERIAYLLEFFREHPCVDCGESDPDCHRRRTASRRGGVRDVLRRSAEARS